MNCSLGHPPPSQTSGNSTMLLVARCADTSYDVGTSYDDTNFEKDHWRHCRTSSNSHADPTSERSRTSQHPRMRNTYSQSRSYNPMYPSSLPSSPLSTSGVFDTPPTSAHLPHQSPYSYPTHTSSSLTSSGVHRVTSHHSESLTASLPSQNLQYTYHHRNNDHYSSIPSSTETYRHAVNTNAHFPGGFRRGVAHREPTPNTGYDWRSESWSDPSTNRYMPHLVPSGSAHPLTNRSTLSYSSSSMGPRSEIPSPSLENHPDSSPPHSGMVSPRHMSSYHKLSSNFSSPNSLIDIVSHPEDTCVVLGAPFELRCEARILYCTDTPTYQWCKDEDYLIGEVGCVLRVERASKEDLGYYFCVVSSIVGSCQRKSSTACVKTFYGADPSKPVIIDQPESTVVAVLGQRLILRLAVRACPNATYQWLKNGIEIPSSADSELVFRCVNASDEGHYMCSIKNELGAILSDTYHIYVTRSMDDHQNPLNNNLNSIPETQPPSNTATYQSSSTTFNPLHLSRRSLSPTKQMRPPQPQNNIPIEVVQFVTSQICRQIGLDENTEGVRLALSISPSDAEGIRLSCSNLSDRVKELICLWIRITPYPSISELEESLRRYGFRVSVPTCTTAVVQGPPVIRVHPESSQINAGESVEMAVEAEGGSNLTYQWYKDGLPYPGLTQSKVMLTDVQEPSTGLYYCCVKNSYGSVDSHPARIDIIPMKLKLPPSLQGSSFYYDTPNATGFFSPPPNLRTRSNESFDESSVHNLTPRFTSSMSERFENLRLENVDEHHCPVIVQQPVSQSLSLGDALNLKITCKGSGTLRYSWYFNGLAIHNEKQSEFSLNCFTDDDIGDYSCEVSSEYGTVMSEKAVVTLAPDDDEENEPPPSSH